MYPPNNEKRILRKKTDYTFSISGRMSNRVILFLILLVMVTETCRTPSKPDVTTTITCDIPGTRICPDDTLECCCIENAHWNADSSACVCGDGYLFSGDTLCVPDTTEHGEIIWEYDTLGVGYFLYPSLVRDVEIVDENNIWIVGSFWIDDSTFSPYSPNYNAAHWNGDEWELILIVNPDPINGIIYFSEDDIWMVNGYPIHWDGNEWTLYPLHNYGMQVAVEHLWGTSSSDLYFVGRSGSIVHYDGVNFVQMDSLPGQGGTDVDLKDVWGITTGDVVWTVGYKNFDEAEILQLIEGQWQSWHYQENYLDNNPLTISGQTVSIWTGDPSRLFVLTHLGFYKANGFDPADFTKWSIMYPNTYGKIRGINYNDIYFTGEYGSVWHYNGINLRRYATGEDILYFNLDVKDDLIVAVGIITSSSHAVIAKGRRVSIQ